jgi:hypothetical protein
MKIRDKNTGEDWFSGLGLRIRVFCFLIHLSLPRGTQAFTIWGAFTAGTEKGNSPYGAVLGSVSSLKRAI